MFSHRSFLMLGDSDPDIANLIKGGYEVYNYRHFFKQEIDRKGKVTTRAYGGFIQLTLTQVPPRSRDRMGPGFKKIHGRSDCLRQ